MRNGNGNGYNGRYTAGQFIEAIHGTGGIISALAEKVGCAWHTARDAIDRWPTVKRAWENERSKVTDLAQRNVIKAIKDEDLPTSKWWLQLMDPQFVPTEKRELSSDSEVTIRVVYGADGKAKGTA
jgi:hypothetical protein